MQITGNGMHKHPGVCAVTHFAGANMLLHAVTYLCAYAYFVGTDSLKTSFRIRINIRFQQSKSSPACLLILTVALE